MKKIKFVPKRPQDKLVIPKIVLPIAGKQSKQYKDQENLRKNLQFVLDHFDEYTSKDKRPNYLMGIGISCQPGIMRWDYGFDIVVGDMKLKGMDCGHSSKWVKRDKTL